MPDASVDLTNDTLQTNAVGKSNLRISVALCTFNGERFLKAQLESIAAQERLPDELIVCDDGSLDRTVEIAQHFAQQASFPVRLVVNPENLGLVRNFEQAILLCSGDIVALADQDDVWYPNKLKRLEEAFLRSSATVAAFSDADLIDDSSVLQNGSLWRTYSFDRKKQKQFANDRPLDVLMKQTVVTGATMAFRRALFDLLTPIPAKHIHDRWIAWLLATRGPIAAIDEPLMQYRRHATQQIGPGPGTLGVRDRIAFTKTVGAELWLDEIERFRELKELLNRRAADFPDAKYAQNAIDGKIRHLAQRAGLPSHRLARIPTVLRETVNGHYWRYSGGLRSIAKDLFLSKE